jgi:dienelactone hydrolase
MRICGRQESGERRSFVATIVLIAALVGEAAFATYCFMTHSSNTKSRSILRIGAFAAFIAFFLASVFQWSFRWYGLAALLLVWSVLGALTLIRGKQDGARFRPQLIVLKAIAMLALMAIAAIPALVFPQYEQPVVTGKHEVATVNYTYTDESRIETFATTGGSRTVNVQLWYPRDSSDRYPLVVFSHGAFGWKASNTSTFVELASNGYVVCSIDHPYHALYTIGADHRVVTVSPSFFQEVVDANNGKYDEATAFKIEQKWMLLRTTDIGFVLDTVLAQARDAGSDSLYQKIDTEKIGLMGHSLGGAASAQVARQRTDIRAVVNLDSDLLGEYLDYSGGKYVMNDQAYPVPILTILADDMVRLIAAIPDANTSIAVKRIRATAPNAFEVHIAGTNHQSLTDLPLYSPFLVSIITSSVPKAGGGESAYPERVIGQMNATVLEFYNAFLKGEGSFTSAGDQ